MSNRGWIKLHRKIADSPMAGNIELLGFWIILLSKATHRPFTAIIGTSSCDLKPGQFATGRKRLAADCAISESKVERFLKLLVKLGQIEQQTNRKFRVISITNWGEYQDAEQQVNNKRTTSEQQVNNKRTHTRTQEHKNRRTEEVKTPTKRKKLAFDPTGKDKYEDHVWLSKEQFERVRAYFKKKGHGKDVFDEAVRELDRWFADNPTMRAKRVDDAKALMGWPLDRAIERKRRELSLDRQIDFNNR